jgi:hypothetical protein
MENACEWWVWRDEARDRGRFDPFEVRTFDLDWLNAVPRPCRQCPRCIERLSSVLSPRTPRR